MNIKRYLPNIFTFLNLALGILAIMWIFKENCFVSGLLILLAAVMDRYDGKIARKLNATSEIGKELDSLSDLISFGVAPTLLMWNIALNQFGVVGIIITILYSIAGAYRLARYNVMEFDGVYYGIPITMSGGIVAIISLYLTKYYINIVVLAVIMLLLSYTMITKRIKLKKR
ncbi:CDP-diacylglycerol--serine O-phosphatidyltransferase [Clostridiaceae bacterium M8S5]|nr:CDP-diacylglycerol--serine O-phosphatidyltransferase [Clostridiaceae bacterium M8S5]